MRIRPLAFARRRWKLLTGLFLLFVGGAAIFWWSSVSGGNRAYAAICAKLDAEEPGWRFADQQAAVPELPAEKNSYTAVLAKVLGPREGALGSTWVDLDELRVLPESMPLEAAEELGRFTHERKEQLAIVRRLVDYPIGRHPIRYTPDFISTLLPSVQDVRGVAALLKSDALIHAEFGDFDTALTDVRAIGYAGESFGHSDSMLIVTLVRIAIHAIQCQTAMNVLALGEAPEAQLAKLQAELLERSARNILADSIFFERAMSHEMFAYMQANFDSGMFAGLGAGAAPGGKFGTIMLRALYLPNAKFDTAAMLTELTEARRISLLPSEEVIPRMRGWDKEFKDKYGSPLAFRKYLLTRLLLPSTHKVSEAYIRWLAYMRTTAVGIACERYRMKHKTFPAKLEDLVPVFLDAVPFDPYTGKTFHYQKTEDGVQVYSGGSNGIDDGGHILPNRRHWKEDAVPFDEEAVGPPPPPNRYQVIDRSNPRDIGFRLWNLDARKKPAKVFDEPFSKEP